MSDSALPVTAEQRRMYLHHRMHPGDSSLNGPFVYEIRGDVDAERLRSAAERVVRASIALNLTFDAIGDGLVARDNRARGYRVALEPLDGDEHTVISRVRQLAETPLPPDQWPLFHLRLWTAADRVYLAVVFSHIVCDAAALRLLFDHIALAYVDPDAAAARVEDLELHPGVVVEAPAAQPDAVGFFRSELAGLTSLASGWLPVKRTPDGRLPGTFAAETCAPDLTEQIRSALGRYDVQPFPFYLAAYAVMLSRLVGNTRVVIGIPLANRFGRRQRRTVGHFVNTLPLTVDLADYATFDQVCRMFERKIMRLLRYQDFDLATHLAEIVDGQRPPAPVLDNVFSYYRLSLDLALPDAVVRRLTVPRTEVKYPLSITVENSADDLLTLIADLGTEVVAGRPLECYRHVLDQVSRCFDQPLADITMLGAEALDRLDRLVNSRRTVDGGVSVSHALEAVARRYPDRIAVADEQGEIRYADLAARVDHVARWLVDNVESRYVAVSGERTTDLVVAMLGVVTAGKAYVPIEASAPAERLRRITDQFDALPLLVAGGTGLDLTVDRRYRLADVEAAPVSADPVPGGTPDSVAYVIFTSGSTGPPKGVEVTHAGLTRLFRSTTDIFGFTPDDTWCMFHSHAFDFSVWEMFGALLNGARLVIVPQKVAQAPADFAELLCAQGVTVLNQTPSAFTQLLSVLTDEQWRRLSVRLLFLGGEAVRFQALRPWFERGRDRCRVFNIYGPTEGSVWVTYHEVTAEGAEHERDSVIGRPLPDVNLYVVDAHGHQLPIGAPGELLIGGAAPSRGYLNQPEATAAKFVTRGPDAERTYRTSDQCYVRGDGAIVYLGRRDGQVKIRGYRIELGEIEQALIGIPGVRDVAVRVHEPTPGQPQLVGYVVADDGIDEATLRRLVKPLLPAYMVPRAFVRLPALPLTVNGKVDDSALPAPVPRPETSVRDIVAGVAADSVEAEVGRAWAEFVPVDDIDLDSNFFDIGGTSVEVTRVYERLVGRFEDANLAMVDLFDHPTIRSLAAHLRRRMATGPQAEPPNAPVRVRQVGAAARRRRPSA